MNNPSVRPAEDVETIIERYGDLLYRLCILMLKNESDAQDVVQNVGERGGKGNQNGEVFHSEFCLHLAPGAHPIPVKELPTNESVAGKHRPNGDALLAADLNNFVSAVSHAVKHHGAIGLLQIVPKRRDLGSVPFHIKIPL